MKERDLFEVTEQNLAHARALAMALIVKVDEAEGVLETARKLFSALDPLDFQEPVAIRVRNPNNPTPEWRHVGTLPAGGLRDIARDQALEAHQEAQKFRRALRAAGDAIRLTLNSDGIDPASLTARSGDDPQLDK